MIPFIDMIVTGFMIFLLFNMFAIGIWFAIMLMSYVGDLINNVRTKDWYNSAKAYGGFVAFATLLCFDIIGMLAILDTIIK
ncbi:hypothetical protein_gp159 [Bacillus phage vB_BceM_WH1]|nr:hypothetical protein_gp159 [Bacillus phage vB_BceM_WH1]